MTTYAIIVMLAACIVAVAWLGVWKHGLGRDHKEAADDALRKLYGRYRAEVGALTQTHLLRAPADEEWLAGIRARVSAGDASQRQARITVGREAQALRMRAHDHAMLDSAVLRLDSDKAENVTKMLRQQSIDAYLLKDEASAVLLTLGALAAERGGPSTGFSGRSADPEGRYLAGPGKPMFRQITVLQDQRAAAAIRAEGAQAAVERARNRDQERKVNHRGGDRSWLLRLLIPLAVLAEAVTAYVAVEALVPSQSLAIGLGMLAALIGGGMACILANRRLNRLGVPATARILEGILVAVLAVLRYDSLRIHGGGFLAAAGASALAALISALGLLGIEEAVAETRTFSIFLSSLQVSWNRGRCAVAGARLARIQAKVEAAAEKLQQHFLDFLLKTDGLPLGQTQSRTAPLLEIATAPVGTASKPSRHTHKRAGRRRSPLLAAAAAVVTGIVVTVAASMMTGTLTGGLRPAPGVDVFPAASSGPSGLHPLMISPHGSITFTFKGKSSVGFEPNSVAFADSAAAVQVLTPIARWLAADLPRRAEVEGTTADVGPMSGQIKLSRLRAEHVRDELIALGAKPAQISATGVGSNFPQFLPDRDSSGRLFNVRAAFNRSVRITLELAS